MKGQSVSLGCYPAVGRTWSFYLLLHLQSSLSCRGYDRSIAPMSVYDFHWKQIKLRCKEAAHCRLRLVFGLMFTSRYDFPKQPTIPSVNPPFINAMLPAFGPSLTAMRIQMQYKWFYSSHTLTEKSLQNLLFRWYFFTFNIFLFAKTAVFVCLVIYTDMESNLGIKGVLHYKVVFSDSHLQRRGMWKFLDVFLNKKQQASSEFVNVNTCNKNKSLKHTHSKQTFLVTHLKAKQAAFSISNAQGKKLTVMFSKSYWEFLNKCVYR